MWVFTEVQERSLLRNGRQNMTLEINSTVFLSELQLFGIIQLQFEDFCCGLCYFPLYSLTAKREHRCEAGSCQ